MLGPLLLTGLLRSLLATSPDARVVFVSSGGTYTQRLRADDPEYRGATAYARTKRMQATLVPLPARRYAAEGIGMHPGWADTPGVAGSLPGTGDRHAEVVAFWAYRTDAAGLVS